MCAAVLAVACAREPAGPRKTQLARLPVGTDEVAIADDGATYAYVEKDADRARIVRNGVRGPDFPEFGPVTFSPITRKLFYWAGSSTAGPGYLVADGTRIGDFGKDGTIVFSADGTRWATVAGMRENGTTPGPVVVLADGVALGRHPDASVPAISPDGRHIAYLVSAGGRTKLVVDGAERATYPPASKECAPRRKREPRGASYWPQFQVNYLSDGTLAVMTEDADGWGVYRDGTRIASYPASMIQLRPYLYSSCSTARAIAAWSFTAAGNAIAWWERLEGADDRWRLVVDGKPVDDVVCSSAWLMQPPELSRDGRHVVYACTVEKPIARVFVVADGRRYGPYREVWAYSWSDDGAHVGYGATGDEESDRPWRYYVDGEPRSEPFVAVWRPRVEAGTGRIAWIARLAEGERGVIGVERRRIASFDAVLWGPTFLRPGTVTWVIRRGRWLTRIDAPTG